MSNRTNRTLSANTNRLDLGTRSLAILAGVNNGTTKTLRLRLAHASHLGSFARVGRMDIDPAMITPPRSEPAKPSSKWASESAESKPSPESSPRSSWPVPARGRGYRRGAEGLQVVVVAGQPQVSRRAASARACRPACRATLALALAAAP